MSVSFDENVAVLERAFSRIEEGAAAGATAMAKYLAERARDVTLRRASHSPGEWYRARPRAAPAYASGNLSRSMFYVPASAGLRASAWVGNSADYSRILEFGCVITPVSKKFMHWTDSGGSWYHQILVVPPHPYLEPTTDEAIADGSLRDAAIEGFEPYDP